VNLVATVGQVVEKYRDVVTGIFPGVAASARAVKDDAFEAVAVERVEGGAEAFEDRVVDGGGGHGALYHMWHPSTMRERCRRGS